MYNLSDNPIDYWMIYEKAGDSSAETDSMDLLI